MPAVCHVWRGCLELFRESAGLASPALLSHTTLLSVHILNDLSHHRFPCSPFRDAPVCHDALEIGWQAVVYYKWQLGFFFSFNHTCLRTKRSCTAQTLGELLLKEIIHFSVSKSVLLYLIYETHWLRFFLKVIKKNIAGSLSHNNLPQKIKLIDRN